MGNALEDLFIALQERLSAELHSPGVAFDHPVYKGNASEANWLKMLGDHLPLRYQTSAGFVVDHEGSRSEAIDVIIYDRQYTPLLYNRDDQRMVPAEAVYAAFEVKQHLTKSYIDYAGDKVASVRRLKRTSAPIAHAGGQYAPRALFPILGGILCRESTWNPPLGDALNGALGSLPREKSLDIGCVVNAGTFQASRRENGELDLHIGPAGTALAEFFLRLLASLQSLGTVPAIDYQAYGKTLGITL